MLPRADGGVVSSKLIVYGTVNVRVVDASIIPLHISAHVSTSDRSFQCANTDHMPHPRTASKCCL